MSNNLSLFKKVRCRFLHRSTGQPLPGVIASLSVRVGDPANLAQLPVATLCTDATGYMSFDLKPFIDPLIDLGLATASGLFISAPTFGLTNYDLLGSLVAAPHDGAEKKDANVSGSEASAIGGKMMMPVATTNGEKKEPPCIVFPIYLENRLGDEHGSESASCVPTRLPSIQSPDICDYKVSPFSFVTPAALNLGNDCCEILLPSSLPIQQYRFYKVVVKKEKVDGDTPTVNAVNVSEALKDESQGLDIKLGEILEFRQDWYSLGHSLGEIKYSLPLAPGESTQLAVIEWSRDDLASRTDKIRATEFLDHNSRRDRAIEETVEAALREEQGGNSHMGSTSGTATGSQYVTWTGNHAFGGAISYSYGNRDLAAESLQDLHDRVLQSSSSIRSLNSTVIVQASQTEKNALQTRRVANHNHCHALTIQYYEVLRHYRMTTKFSGRRKAVLIPFVLIKLDTWQLALRFRTVLEQTLLDQSLRKCFEALIRLHLASSVYDAPMPPKVEGATDAETIPDGGGEMPLLLSEGRGKALEIKNLKKGDKIKISASGSIAMAGSGGRGSTGVDPDGYGPAPGPGGNFPHLAINLRELSLIYKIGYTGDWKQGSKKTFEVNAVKDGDITIIFGVNTLPNGFGDFTNPPGVWTIGYEYPSRAPATPKVIDPSKDDALDDKAFRKSDDELCSARLLNHLMNNQGFYNSAVWTLMDVVERRLYLEKALENRPDILSGMDNKPLAISGNYVAFEYKYSVPPSVAGMPNEPPIEDIEDIIALPTRGLFAEAQMGHCNSCEKRDVTRMWDWTEMTAETPPEISGISPGPKGVAPSITQGQLPGNVVQIAQPQTAPDPTGLANALNVLKTPDIFRDMAGLDEVSKLLGELVKAASDNNSKALALQAKEKVDGIKKSTDNNTGTAAPSGVSAADAADRFSLLPEIKAFAKDIGLTDEEYKQFALDQMYGTRSSPSPSDAESMEDKLKSTAINLDKHCTPIVRSFSPGNPLVGKSADSSGKTTLRAVVTNAPAGSTWHWSVADGAKVQIVSPTAHITEILAGHPGLVDFTFEAADPGGKSLAKATSKLCVPQFIAIYEDAAAFNGQLVAYHLDDVKAALLQRVKAVVDFVMLNANVRTIWTIAPFNEALPAQLEAGGFAAGKFNRLTIRGRNAAEPGTAGEVPSAGAGATKPDEPIDIWPGAYTTPGTDVGIEVSNIVAKVASLNMTDPVIKTIWIEIMGRLIGETIAHEVHHALLAFAIPTGHNSPLIPWDLMNFGTQRSFVQRTGIEILDMANFPRPGSYRDGGVYAISGVQTANQTKVDSVFPVPPALL